MLVMLLLCSNVFDRTINAKFHPENVGRGLEKGKSEENV